MGFQRVNGPAHLAPALLAACLLAGAPACGASGLGAHRAVLRSSDVPALAPRILRRLAQAQRWRGARFLGWLPDGAMLVEAHEGRRHALERVSAAQRPPVRLAALSGGVLGAVTPRVGTRLLYAQRSARGPQWYVVGPQGRSHVLNGSAPVLGRPIWSSHGRRIAFLGLTPDGDREAVYVTDAAGAGLPRLMIGGLAGRWRLLDWSSNGRRVLLKYDAGPDDESLYIGRLADGALRHLPLPSARIGAARFAPGGAAVDFISDQDGDYARLLRWNEDTGRVRALSAPAAWSVDQFAASPNGRYIAYTLDDDGRSLLHVINRRLQLDVAVPWVHEGVIENLQFDAGRRLGFTFESGSRPPAAYVYAAGSGRIRRWTGQPGPLDTAAPARVRLVHYPTWDRVDGHWRRLSAYVYLPPGPGPAPVLVLLHAGVAGQFRPRWRPFLQFVANDLGYVVIAPNVRGSGGYGRAFRALADGVQRTDALRDIGALMVWIGLQPGFDAHRIVVMGRGYGGWLAVNALALFERHLLGAIDIDGIAYLAAYVADAPESQRQFRRARFGNARDPQTAEFLRRISPVGNVQRIIAPVLILQGLAGGGERAAAARQMAYLLRFYGDHVELLTAANARRGCTPRADRQAYRAAIAQFLLALKTEK